MLGGAGDDEVAEDSDGDGDEGANYVHPAPSGEAVDAFQAGRGAGLDGAGGKGAEGQTHVEDAAPAGDLVAAVPGACGVVRLYIS